MHPGAVRFRTFVNAVRTYAPRALLPLTSAEACAQIERDRQRRGTLIDGRSPVTPWALVEIARESIVHGVDYGGRTPTAANLRRLCALFADLDDPISESQGASVERFLVRILHQQLPWQESEFEQLARPRALLLDTAAMLPTATAHGDTPWQAALGCGLDDYLSIGFMLFTLASTNGADGWIDPAVFDSPAFAPVRARRSVELIRHVTDTLFTATRTELTDRDRDPAALPENVRQHRFNPLIARPLVRMTDGRLLAPHPLLILQRLSVSSLYYERCTEPAFTNQLGLLFETYVGSHLRLITGADVRPEITLGGDKTVDWIVLLPEVVLLIEVKATSLTEDGRAGLDRFEADRQRTIGRACTQLQRTHDLIQGGDAALAWVPAGRPVRGLIVTREPYWGAVSGFGAPLTTSFPTTVASIGEIEHLGAVGAAHPVGPALLTLHGQHSNNALDKAVAELGAAPRNPILDAAYARSINWR